MRLIKERAYGSYSLYFMEGSDFSFVKTFLDSQRERLERIEFFYPYKDDELKNVLENGFFWGLFDGEELIATFAIDKDEDYAEELAGLIKSCSGIDVGKAYESSGLMVDERYRGQGIAGFLSDIAIKQADESGINLCGVVHTENAASIATFFSRGFELRGVWKMCEGYDFVYLVRIFGGGDEKTEANFRLQLQNYGYCDKIKTKTKYSDLRDIEEHSRLLAEGYRGISICGRELRFVKEYKEEKMNKNQLANAVAVKAGCAKDVALKCCDAVVETIMEALKEGDKVAWQGFGTFEVKTRAARTGINPATRETIEIPESKVINFKASKNSKEEL